MENKIQLWINKSKCETPSAEYCSAAIFNVNMGKESNISSDIREAWYSLGAKGVDEIYEDLLLIAMSVFAADKRVARSMFFDGWTRTIELNIPVIKYDEWSSVKSDLEKMLSFLSGDRWTVTFRASEGERYFNQKKREPQRPDYLEKINLVSLFSGGMDSFCGACEYLSKGKNILFAGFKEYGLLKDVQGELINSLKDAFASNKFDLATFTTKVKSPHGAGWKSENTSRSRSFLFLAAALSMANIVGRNVPVYIPENGFIGLNLPMTEGRKGSCSTRTTHPFYLKQLNSLLRKVGIENEIINPYAMCSKAEMVKKVDAMPVFVNNAGSTISCSHPCNERWNGNAEPTNCGYCYPCLIRKASYIHSNVINDNYKYDALSSHFIKNATKAKKSDVVDLLSAVSLASRSTDQELLKRIKRTGRLTRQEQEGFLRLYKSTIDDVLKLASKDPELLRMMGLSNEAN